MVVVPYEDLKQGMQAMATLEAVKAVLKTQEFCASTLRKMLGVTLEEKNAGAD